MRFFPGPLAMCHCEPGDGNCASGGDCGGDGGVRMSEVASELI
ncbi:hypothetical protein OROGR_008303 [Orobanche gracilis]